MVLTKKLNLTQDEEHDLIHSVLSSLTHVSVSLCTSPAIKHTMEVITRKNYHLFFHYGASSFQFNMARFKSDLQMFTSAGLSVKCIKIL